MVRARIRVRVRLQVRVERLSVRVVRVAAEHGARSVDARPVGLGRPAAAHALFGCGRRRAAPQRAAAATRCQG